MHKDTTNCMNLYDILSVSLDSTLDEIKRSYHKLSLKYHPDKDKVKVSQEKYAGITQEVLNYAYTILSNPITRSEYNHSHMHSVIQTIPIEDMQYDSEAEVFSYSCRCSGLYTITVQELEKLINVIECCHCSLKIRILYIIHDDED
jgi:diphthamide biosynthesis protein 4